MIARFLRRLHEDERGAVLVIQAMAMLIMAGFVWMIISTGERLVQKETIQSSADAASFSAAVVKAKGLNLLAFCNLTIALCTAILGVLQAMVNAFPMTILTLIFMCAGGDADACAAIEPAQQSQADFQGKLAQSDTRLAELGGVMPALSDAEQAIVDGMDDWVRAEAQYVGTHAAYQDNFGSGLSVDVGPTLLPVEQTQATDDVCAAAWKWVGNFEGLFALQIPNLTVRGVEMAETQFTLPDGVKQWCTAAPPHFVMQADWQNQRWVCAASTLDESNLDYRRGTVGMSLIQKPDAPRPKNLQTIARAEFLPWWGQADLWHMDWRARLVTYKDCDDGPQIEWGNQDLKDLYLAH